MNVIEIEGLRTGYGRQIIHDGLDLSVRAGEVFTIVGGSGSGKTTLLRHMLGLEVPLQGSVRVFGGSPLAGGFDAWRSLRRRWGVLFQGGALYSALDVYDNIALPRSQVCVSKLSAWDTSTLSASVRPRPNFFLAFANTSGIFA